MKTELYEQDRQLVARILNGDARAVRTLYGIIRPLLNRLFNNKVKVKEDVDELIQDTFLHFLDALPLFRFQSSLKTFVFGIAHHELMDYWRKKYAKRAIRVVSGQWAADSGQWVVEQSEDVSKRMNLALEQAYAQLKPIQAKLLRWKYEEGISVKEMAFTLGWSMKAVESQLYRARKAFRAVYEPGEER